MFFPPSKLINMFCCFLSNAHNRPCNCSHWAQVDASICAVVYAYPPSSFFLVCEPHRDAICRHDLLIDGIPFQLPQDPVLLNLETIT